MNKKILGISLSLLMLNLLGCGVSPESVVDKVISFSELADKITPEKKAELIKNIKANCNQEELNKADNFLSCMNDAKKAEDKKAANDKCVNALKEGTKISEACDYAFKAIANI